MKIKSIYLVFLLIVGQASAASLTSNPFYTVHTSGTVPNHFADSGSKIGSGLVGYSHMKAYSNCASMVWLNVNTSLTAPGDNDTGNIPLWPNEVFVPDNAVIRQSVYVRSSTGGALSCDTYLSFW